MTHSLASLIFEQWQRTIAEIEDARIDEESAQMLIQGTRQVLRDAGTSAVDEHRVLKQLRDRLPMLTGGHPICKQFITLLDLQLECS